MARKVSRSAALREVARCFLSGAGLTVPGELARVTGLSRPDAGLGNRALVREGYAVMLDRGTYRLGKLDYRSL
jgi:DNA-binding IclR family transcriptional regulator